MQTWAYTGIGDSARKRLCENRLRAIGCGVNQSFEMMTTPGRSRSTFPFGPS